MNARRAGASGKTRAGGSRHIKAALVERERLRTAAGQWQAWGPYLSERQWGTVREDYSPGGSAWDYFPHEHARSRAYRWGEDGLAGFCDAQQRLCLALALWNGRDPMSLLQKDPHFRDHLLFHECFHGNTGRGVGASHQTGWTGTIAKLLLPGD